MVAEVLDDVIDSDMVIVGPYPRVDLQRRVARWGYDLGPILLVG